MVRSADVLVVGLRSGALARLGYDESALHSLNRSLITAALNAYGWTGPWRERRGFDSLVQLSCGIAATGAEASGRDEPVALPAQALDHGTGYLLAAAVGRALTDLVLFGRAAAVRVSLIGTANRLLDCPAIASGDQVHLSPSDFLLDDVTTAWGPARRVPLPGRIDGVANDWALEAGPLGRHEPRWAEDRR